MNNSRRVLWFVGSIVLLGAFFGGAFGRRVDAMSGDSPDVQASLQSFTNVLSAVEENYADPVKPDEAIFGPTGSGLGAIPGMLRTLDPHSTFLDPEAFARFQVDQEGKYFGVGMRIGSVPGKMGKTTIIVVEPLPGSPAFRAGIRTGDLITAVDGQSTTGMDVSQAATLLKGPKGTVVHVTVSREGWQQPIQFTITRDQISERSVDEAFMIRPGIGYIHIVGFTENTNDEVSAALKKFGEDNLQGLILDLRGNGGGLLQQAVEVCNHFLAKGQLIVYHYGRNSAEKKWYATEGEKGRRYPIVVLINHLTASASEIVSGALQDHDRALIMGEPSFGKGLVQSEYPLSEKTLLLLVTAHYYTPSGRLIQRDYKNVSLYDYYYERGPSPHTEVRYTDGGREVFGGGGITPDILVKEAKLNDVQQMLDRQDAFYEFGKYYLGIHKTVPQDFVPDDSVIQDFKSFLSTKHVMLTDQEVTDNLDFIKSHIRTQLVAVVYGESVADRISLENDDLVKKALDSMPQAAQLLENAQKYMALRAQAKTDARP